MLLEIAKITASPEVQPRVALHYPTVESYCEAIRRGDELPPIRVFFDGETHWLTRGFHRLEAYKLHGASKIPADLREGTFQDAILDATESNGDHGLERSPDDLARSIEMTWRVTRELGLKWTQEQIAKHCHCSQQRVSQVLANTRASNSPGRAEKRAIVEKALNENPQASAREIERKTGVHHSTVEKVRKGRERAELENPRPQDTADPDPPRSERRPADEREAPRPEPVNSEPVRRVPRPEDFPTLTERDTMTALVNALRVARRFNEKSWEMAVQIIDYEVGVREHGYRESA